MNGRLDFKFNYFLDINGLSKFKDNLTWIIHKILPQRLLCPKSTPSHKEMMR